MITSRIISSASSRRRRSCYSSASISSVLSSSERYYNCHHHDGVGTTTTRQYHLSTPTSTSRIRSSKIFPPLPYTLLSLNNYNFSRVGRFPQSQCFFLNNNYRHLSTSPDLLAQDDTDVDVQQTSSLPYSLVRRQKIRNVAVIAHVDHGKTTLVDQLLLAAASGNNNNDSSSSSSSLNRLLDSSDIEKERGITITSKVTRLTYHQDGDGEDNNDTTSYIINCVDTPGHADFSAEVDRILSMVDGVCLVVDVAEGPKSQTKYVLSRALALGLKPMVVLNKCDRFEAIGKIDSHETEIQLLELMEALGADEEQYSYETWYASARDGWATNDPTIAIELAKNGGGGGDMSNQHPIKDLLDSIIDEIPEPSVRLYKSEADDQSNDNDNDTAQSLSLTGERFADDPFSLAAVNVGYDNYLGRTCNGRIVSGCIRVGDKVTLLKQEAQQHQNDEGASGSPSSGAAEATGTVSGIFVYEGIDRTPLGDGAVAYAGDIVTIAGLPDSIAVGDTVTGSSDPVSHAIDTPPLAPPTLAMEFGANDGPLAGREGSKLTSSLIRNRLMSEADNNVTLKVQISDTDREKTTVYARGELQLGILAETMRREGYEFVISPPRILMKECEETGKLLEPWEEVTVDVDNEYASTVVSSLTGDRKGTLLESSTPSPDGRTRIEFEVPSRGLLGFQTEIATATRGSAVVNHLFLESREHAGNLGLNLEKGKLVSNSSGKATAYALESLAQRGILFIEPSQEVYPGMIIGQNAKQGDLEVNAIRAKEKTNIRTQAKDSKIYLPPPKQRTIEELIGYMQQDELVEVTPESVRLRKQLLDSSARERAARNRAKQLRALKEGNKS